MKRRHGKRLLGGGAVAVAVLLSLGAGAGTVGGQEAKEPSREPTGEEQRLAKQAEELNAEGGRLYGAGKYVEATEACRRALEIRGGLYPRERFPHGHPDLAASINNLAQLYESAGEHAKAEPLLKEALAMRRALYPKERFPNGHPDLAQSINNRAWMYQSVGEYARAEPLYREALAMYRALYPKERFPNGHPDLARSINNLAFLHSSAGEHTKAEPLYQEALAMRRALFPEDRFPHGHNDLARSINNLAGLYHSAGEHTKAEPLYQEALAMYRALYPRERFAHGYPDLARSINNLAGLYHSAGEYARAEPLYREALGMYRALFPRERFPNGHPDLARSISYLATLYRSAGEYARAQPLYQEALAMRRALFPKERFPNGHPDLAISINNLAGLYDAAGEHAKAEPLYKEALGMRRALYPKERFPHGHPDLARSTNNLALLYWSTGEYAKAEPLFQEALAMRRALFPKDRFPHGHNDLAQSINGLALLYKSAGEYARAESLHKEALAMRRALFPKDRFPRGHNDLAQSINNLALLYSSAGEHAKAEPLHQEALAMFRALYPKERFPNGHPDLAQSILSLADRYYSAGDYGRAAPLLQEALGMYRGLAEAFLSAAAEAEAMNFLAKQPLSRDGFLSVTRRLPAEPDHYNPVWAGRAPLLRLLERRRLDLAAARDPAAAGLATRLADARLKLSRALLAAAGAPAAELSRLTADKEKLEKELAALLGLTPGIRREEPGPQALADTLGRHAAFIDFVRYIDFEQDPKKPGRAGLRWTPRYVAFVLRQGKAAARVELGEAEPIERAWADWRKAIVAGRPDRAEATALARLIWQPLRPHLPAECRTVWLCPDGALCQVPWAALPGQDKDTMLLEDHALAVVPHGPALAAALRGDSAEASAKKEVLVVGGVDYDGAPATAADGALAGLRGPAVDADRRGVKYLPGTLTELRRIAAQGRAALKAEPVELSGRRASVAALLAELPKARYAHVATHGFFADASVRSVLQVDEKQFRLRGLERAAVGARHPLVLSGLVLAGANRPDVGPDRGIVTAEGVLGLNLEGMDLAVLSACETGLGEVAGGEGVLGLVRAFHVAGSRNVVASLWRVEDASTAALMGRFYHQLWAQKQPPLEALRQAQLAVYRHPGRIKEWAARGIDVADAPLPKGPTREARPAEHARTAQWAAFLLSGPGR
jgi:CHAT domain-containing protein